MYLKEGAFEEKENGKMGKQKTEKEEEIQMKEIYIKIKEPKKSFHNYTCTHIVCLCMFASWLTRN